MAKMGEGDSRWIVAERKDGANVNAWHWEEKSMNQTTHDAIKALFKGFALGGEADGVSLRVAEVSEIEGDVTLAQRKGKIMCYFELKMTLRYAGTDLATQDEVGGKMTVPDVDHDTFRGDFTIAVAAADSGASQSKAERWVFANGRAAVRRALVTYFEQLFVDNNVGKNLVRASPTTGGAAPTTAGAAPAPAPRSAPAPAASSASSSGDATSFEQVLVWRVPPAELWNVLTDAPRASAYTRAPARIDPRPSGAFEFMGGAMSGYFVDLQHPSRLAMQWRLGSWPSGVFSTVVITLAQEEVGVTRMTLAQAGVPAGEVERVRTGWTVNFWNPIKAVFGFGFDVKA
jgi:activator of HSP90 ATPase